MLGVRRSTVTVIAGSVNQARLIHHHRSTITELDRRGLESVAGRMLPDYPRGYERALMRKAN